MDWAYNAALNGTPHSNWLKHCPYGAVGETLWVRDTFRIEQTAECRNVYYQADEE